jgi:tRNA-2-methylthio-N6-dimethylallyladenosine synthase
MADAVELLIPQAQGRTALAEIPLFVNPYGCQMNVYDSARMAETLTPLGCATDRPEAADMVILNTTISRRRRRRSCFSELGRLWPEVERHQGGGG